MDAREIDWLHEALECRPSERESFIEAKHASHPERVRRLLCLLAAHRRAEQDGFESSPASVQKASPVDPTPDEIGPYRVLERIGEGGMGVVYAAQQSVPFRRRVAIKVVKLGMDSREVIARFEAERQALAMLDHPGVAKALDAGVTELGRPYFVMELVKGLSLIDYCSKHRLALRERLGLFADVCAAIEHAHQKGIIHRDLKPSNILVAVQEGQPVPKVIDFGVAKATAARLTEKTVFTEQGRLIGTPEYMSPEQAEMSGLDVDTRTDVYSLGVILYELLTGTLPFDSKALRAGGYSEILRIIREVDPPRPSTRLNNNACPEEGPKDPTGVAARSVRGELDWIVMRSMEKDRTRRYGTASALCEDIRRYLTDRPVLAGPPSVAYNIQKFVKRHRFVAVVSVLALLSTVAGITGLAVGLVRAREAEELAMRRADNAQATAGFLERVLFQADPEYGGGSLSLLEVMESAGEMIARDLSPYPEVEASVRESLGVAYRRRSMFVEAAPHLRRSLEIRRDLFGDDHPETARSFIAMAGLLFEHEGKVEVALDMLGRALDHYESHGLVDTPLDAWLQLDIGIVNLAGDRLSDSQRAFDKCARLLTRDRGRDHADVSRPLRGNATIAMSRGDIEEAERLARLGVMLCEGEGEEYIGARAKLVLARILLRTERLDEARGLLTQAGDQLSKTVGDRHIRIAERDACLSEWHLRKGEFAEAEQVAERCESMRRQILHPDHWAILEARLLRQRARVGLGDIEGAESELLEIEEAARDRLGLDHPLSIRIAEARLECIEAAGDASLSEVRAERLSILRQSRAERLEADG